MGTSYPGQEVVCALLAKTKTRRNLARTCVTLWLPDHLARFWVRQRVTVSTVNPAHLRTLALLGANVGFLSNFSGGSTEPRRFPGADEQAVSWRPWGADVPASVFGLFVHGGGDGAQRVRTHNPTSFPPKFAARSGSLGWKAMASKAGETVGLLSGSCSPQAALCASTPP